MVCALDTLSTHLLLEYRGCEDAILDCVETVPRIMTDAAVAAGATVLQTVVHKFEPTGLSCVLVLAESHLSIHTWPHLGYAAVDFYTCGECDPRRAEMVLAKGFRATSVEMLVVERGLEPNRSIRVMDHTLREGSTDDV